jgi:hypothetical protein
MANVLYSMVPSVLSVIWGMLDLLGCVGCSKDVKGFPFCYVGIIVVHHL